MSLELIIFDWDGTLMNSADRIVCCMQQAARDVGLPVLEDHDIRCIIGLGLPEALRALYPDAPVSRLHQMRDRYACHFVEAEREPSELFHHVEETLATLHEKKIKMAVATGKSRKGLERVWSGMPLRRYFATSRCADETQSKPHPRMVFEILTELGVPPHKALVVGDTTHDLEMAKRAGVSSMAVSYGAHLPEQLKSFTPLLMMDSVSEILAWVDKMPRGPDFV